MVVENMGSQASKSDDQQPLLDDTDEVPIIEMMSVVVMGHHGVGKNTVGNAILMKKAFTFMDSFKDHYLKHENTTFGRHVSVTRVPGWGADLGSERNRQFWLLIKDSMRSVVDGPHVIILVVDTDADHAMATTKLRQLLGDRVLQHILITSVASKQLVVRHSERKHTVIKRCKYHVRCGVKCVKQNLTLIEAIEDFIISKPNIRFYDAWKRNPDLELQRRDLLDLVEGLRCKIAALSDLRDSNRSALESKTEEIEALKSSLKKKEDLLRAKEEELTRVKSGQGPIELQRKIGEMEKAIKDKNKEIERLKIENRKLKAQNRVEETSFIRPKSTDWNSNESVPLISAETADKEASKDDEVSKAVKFLKKNRKELIERIVAVKAIADELYPLIGRYKYEQILQAPTLYEQNRQIYIITEKGGKKLQAKFYKILLKYEKYLVEDLMETP